MLELTSGNVKTAMSDAGAKSSDLWIVPIENIRVIEGFNIRERSAAYESHIVDIGESILANGYRKDKPLTGYVGRDDDSNLIYVTDGHTRLEAVAYANSKGADIKVLPVVTTPPGTNMEDLTVGLFTSNSGRALTELEKAEGCKRLVGYGLEPADIGRRTGIAASRVNDLLLLSGSAIVIRKMVAGNEVSATEAIVQIKKHGSKAADHLGEKLLEAKSAGKKKLTPRALKEPKPEARDLLAEGVVWINHHADESTVQALTDFLGFITGAALSDIAGKITVEQLEAA